MASLETGYLLDLSFINLHFEHAFADTNIGFIDALVKFVGDNNQNNSPYFIEITNNFSHMEFLQILMDIWAIRL